MGRSEAKDVYVPSEAFRRNLARALAVSVAPIGMEQSKEKTINRKGLETVEDYIARGGTIEHLPLGGSSLDDVYDEKFNQTGKL